MRAVIYARVSSQAQKERLTIKSQLSTLPAFVASRGWDLVGRYIDDGRSASTGTMETREAFGRLLADAAAGIFDVVVAVEDDRLTRSEDVLERLEIYGRFKRAGVKLAFSSTGQVIDPTSSTDELLAIVKGWVAADENRKRRERTVRGKLAAVERGRKPAGPTPYGYRYDRGPAAGLWTVAADEAEVVREIFHRTVYKRETLLEIAADLEKRGVPRPRGGAWHRRRVWDILRSPAYMGRYVADRRRGLSISVPAIVDESLWSAAQVELSTRSGPRRRQSANAMLTGIAMCGVCGGAVGITGATQKRADGTRILRQYYCCSAKRSYDVKGVKRSCSLPNRPRAVTEDAVWRSVLGVLQRPDLLDEVERIAGKVDGTDWDAEAGKFQKRIDRLDKAQSTILERYRRGKIPDAVMDAELDSAARERAILVLNRDQARQAAETAVRGRGVVESLRAEIKIMGEELSHADDADRKALLRLLVPGRDGYQVTVYPDRIEVAGLLRPAATAQDHAVCNLDGSLSRNAPYANVPFRSVIK